MVSLDVPARNVIKHYVPDYFYHIYNRGVNKNAIFIDKQDYLVFTNLLERCLDPNLKMLSTGFLNTHSVSEKVNLIAYCLMPNHFHFLLEIISRDGITKLLRRISTSYAMYFNKKYKREGAIFQGKPRGIVIESDSYLLHLSRYIHQNPLEHPTVKNLRDYPHSSYQNYLGLSGSAWVKPNKILAFFKTAQTQNSNFKDIFSYESFVENFSRPANEVIGICCLD